MQAQVTAVTFILQRPDGKVLMQLRDDGRGRNIAYPSMWSFPGGGVEREERPVEAVIREIYEEYRLKVHESECVPLFIYVHDGKEVDQVFICEVAQSVVPILCEGAGTQWMGMEKIKNLTLAWEQDKILSQLKKFLS